MSGTERRDAVAESRREQGFDTHVTDAAVIERIATVLASGGAA